MLAMIRSRSARRRGGKRFALETPANRAVHLHFVAAPLAAQQVRVDLRHRLRRQLAVGEGAEQRRETLVPFFALNVVGDRLGREPRPAANAGPS